MRSFDPFLESGFASVLSYIVKIISQREISRGKIILTVYLIHIVFFKATRQEKLYNDF